MISGSINMDSTGPTKSYKLHVGT